MNLLLLMVFMVDGYMVLYFLWGWDIDLMLLLSYFGIGKYMVSFIGIYCQYVDLVKVMLSSRVIFQIYVINKGVVFVYLFDKGGYYYEGMYNYQFDD